MPITLCILLWESPGKGPELAAFEDAVLELLPRHNGRVVSRHATVGRGEGDPLEVQLIELPDDDALADYMADPDRSRLADEHQRDEVISRTQVLRVEPRS
ncbi:DUF1330 domain-containing protein [Rhodococcus sp. IEGM 1408]|uniref:DUF1330 domain-containing protein n=1 Tax=Rhodococcus sp. IEGM 1408 TaxID=3082220 RepID=UPI00295361FC|nr:DUF1330 domain-containing protein [Rhodococcus sp. IEGM 1408]MDV8001330.1 DUF1330 domain-containing protein [Rhodococcus sp. IEGM 1408]